MTGARNRRRLTTALAAMAMLMVTAVAFAAPAAAQDDPQADQLVVKLESTYDVQPTEGQVAVESHITVSNVKGDQRSGSTITSFFWTGHTVWVPDDAQGLSISVDGEPLEWEVFDNLLGVDIIDADFNRNLNFGQTQIVDVTYTLPTYGPDNGRRRINEAFFDLELTICCNFEEIDLTVTIPGAYTVDPPTNLAFEAGRSGSDLQYTYTDNEVTGQFTEVIFADWFGFDESGFDQTTSTTGPVPVALVFPPDDDTWGADTTAFIDRVGDELTTLTGAPWTSAEIELFQAPNRAFGPWGDLDPDDDDSVTVPRDASDEALAATVVRTWLDDGPFDDDRISEGLAIELGSEIVARTGGTATSPSEPNPGGNLDEEGLYWVMGQVADDVGHDELGTLLNLADSDQNPYAAPGQSETVPDAPTDWRRFLDLADRRLESATVVTVFDEYLLSEQESAELARRNETVAAYDAIADRAGGVVPAGIRQAMATWSFDDADALLTTADDVLTERERIVGDDDGRDDDPGLALGDAWADAETSEQLLAVRDGIADRGAELDQSALVRYLVVGAIAVAIAAGAAAAFLVARGRRRPAVVTAGAPPGTWPVPPPADPGWPQPGPSGPIERSTAPGSATIVASPTPGPSSTSPAPGPWTATGPVTPPGSTSDLSAFPPPVTPPEDDPNRSAARTQVAGPPDHPPQGPAVDPARTVAADPPPPPGLSDRS